MCVTRRAVDYAQTPRSGASVLDRVRAGDSAKVKEGRSLLVDAFGRKVAIFRVEGRLFAIDDVCPHRGGPLSGGDIEDGQVLCPLHAWAFDLETGMMRGNPSCRVPVYPVTEEDGVVYLSRPSAAP